MILMKVIKCFVVCAILTLLFALCISVGGEAESVIAESEYTAFWIGGSQLRYAFSVGQTFFVFYVNDTNGRLYYKYNLGRGWSDGIDTHSRKTFADQSAVWFDGTKVSYVIYAVSTPSHIRPSIRYRMGTPFPDGRIVWDTPEQEVLMSDTAIMFTNIAVDSLNIPYIAYANESGANCWRWVTKSKFSNGTWDTEIGYPLKLAETIHAGCFEIIIPLEDQKMFLAYHNLIPKRYDCWEYNGTDWNKVDPLENALWTSMVSVGDEIHATYRKPSGHVAYKNRTYGNGWGSEIVFYNQSAVDGVVMAKNKRDLMVFWLTDNGTLFYKRFLNNQWQDNVAYLTISKPNFSSLNCLNCPYEYEGDTIVIWQNVDGPYRLLFSFIDLNEEFFVVPTYVSVIVVLSLIFFILILLIYMNRRKKLV